MTFQFRTRYTYCGLISPLNGEWYMIASTPAMLTFRHVKRGWKMKLTRKVAAKVMRE